MALTASQISLVQASIPALESHGKAVTTHFYQNLLINNPSLKSIFNLTHQRAGSQPFALASVLLAYASHITNPAALSSAVEAINHRHASLGVTPPQYALVGTQLLASMSAVLGDAFTPELRDAWAAAYSILADLMIGREKRLYAASAHAVPATSLLTIAQPAWGDAFRTCTLIFRKEEASKIVSLRFWPKDWPRSVSLPSYIPGQYISLRVPTPSEGEGVSQIRQYTLSDCPASAVRDGYRITPKKIGVVSSILHGLRVGDEVEVSFPRGVFWYRDDSIRIEGDAGAVDEKMANSAEKTPLVLISAGIGITPMMSILGSLVGERGERKVGWIHGTRTLRDVPFVDALKEAERQIKGLKVRTFVTQPDGNEMAGEGFDFEGRVDLGKLDQVQDLLLGDKRALYHLCGPTGFMESVGKGLKGRGVDGERIKTEVFGAGGASI